VICGSPAFLNYALFNFRLPINQSVCESSASGAGGAAHRARSCQTRNTFARRVSGPEYFSAPRPAHARGHPYELRMHYAWARCADKYVVSIYIDVNLGTNQYEKHRELSREWLQSRLVSASRPINVPHTSVVGLYMSPER